MARGCIEANVFHRRFSSIALHVSLYLYEILDWILKIKSYVIYFAWNSLRNNGPSVLDNAFPGTGGHYTIGGHFGHCLEIIRNALMCYADPTLEPTLDMDGETINEIGLASGWGTLHTCKNYEKLVTWIDAQEKAWSTGEGRVTSISPHWETEKSKRTISGVGSNK